MSFTDYIFFPAFALFLLIYFLVPKKIRWIILLLASVLFYLSYGLMMLPFAAGAIVVAWVSARIIQRKYDSSDALLSQNPDADRKEKALISAKAKRSCKWILWPSCAVIIIVLILTKVDKFSLIVPLGISYYSMSLIGYIADVYWRKERAEKNILKLALFALYFPKILEGPISKHRNIAASLEEGEGFDYTRFCHGLQRMLWGFFKKLCIADRLNLMVNTVFSDCSNYHGSVLLVAAVFGAFQLYCDFSGCMDIALGASEILGIKVEENFRQPFFSESAPEFWRRWHITLGVWFKDYIYMPLVVSPRLINLSAKARGRFGKRFGKAVLTVIPLVAVWLLTGLWHGTGWNYILWGIYWGFLIIISNVFEPEFKKVNAKLHINTQSAGFKAYRKIRTVLLFVIARIIILPGSLGALKTVISRIILHFAPWHLVDQSMYEYGLDRQNFWLAIVLIIFLMIIEKKQADGVIFRDKIDSFALPWRWIIYLAGIFFILIFGVYGAGFDASSFVYMNY